MEKFKDRAVPAFLFHNNAAMLVICVISACASSLSLSVCVGGSE